MQGTPALILLIEDNASHAELVMRGLAEHRVANQIVHLADGQSAVEYLFRQGKFSNPADSPRPDLILLDLRLPRLDGIQVLQVIKESEPLRRIPVVILTTSNAERDVARAYTHHANSYLVKPVGFEEFSKLLQDLGLYWLAWNTHPFAET